MYAIALLALLFLPSFQAPAQVDVRSAQDWVAWVDSIGKMDPQPWIAETNALLDSSLYDYQDRSLQLSKADWAALQESKKTGRLDQQAALRIFQDDAHLAPVELIISPDSAKITWLAPLSEESKDIMDMILLNTLAYDWEAQIYFLKDGCLLGKHHAFHKYGLETASYVDASGNSMAYHNVSLESGTGIWETDLVFYTEKDQHLLPMGWIFQEVNLANPGVHNRHLEANIISLNPLTVRYEWKVDLGFRYQIEQPTFSGKTIVTYQWNATKKILEPQFKTDNLNAEKLLSFKLSAPEELFIHAWQNELKADLQGKNKTRKLAAIEYLESMNNQETKFSEPNE